MKIRDILISLLILVCAGCVLAYAQDDEEGTPEEIQGDIEKYEKKLSDLEKKEKTLANEISFMDGQVALTQLRIQSSLAKISKTQSEIDKLSTDIDDLKLRIDKLITSIEYQNKVLSSRIRERYKSGGEAAISLFGTDSIKRLIQKTQYLSVMEQHDNKLILEMKKTKDSFDTQKRLFEESKAKQELLRQQLLSEKANLDSQKVNLENQKYEKQELLKLTQNDEAKYQGLLEEARQELSQITGAVNVLKNEKATSVKQGDVIGTQGNTGYSFGAHLHFGVYKYSSFDDITGWNWYYSKYVDPSSVLKSKTVYWNTGCETPRNKTIGGGSWVWPLSSPTVSQGFGYTCWSARYYGGKVHPAYDMYGPVGSKVYAVADGQAYSCRNCLGDGGNGVFIFHKDGYMTVYWHLQ